MSRQFRRLTRTAITGLALAALPMGAIAAPADHRGPGTIELVSAALGGGGGDGESASHGWKELSVSGDGRYVVFSSSAIDLVPGDTNGQQDVFVRDTKTDRTTRVSVGTGGVEGNGMSRQGSISADGRFVAFNSYATNLYPGDTNDTGDVFVRDLRTGKTTLTSVGPDGPAVYGAHMPEISADGKHVVFTSGSPNLVADDTNSTEDIFVRDLVTRQTERVSVSASGQQLDIYSREPAISGNGRFVAYVTAATTVSVYDRQKNTTRVISDGVTLDPSTTFHEIGYTSFSADGRFVLFNVTEYEFIGGDEVPNFWLRDLRTGKLDLITADSAGKPSRAIGLTLRGDVSGDGRYVTVGTTARLTPADTDDFSDVYRIDRKTGSRVWISRGQQPNEFGQGGSSGSAISDDGRHVAFQSDSDGLVPGATGQQTYQWSS
jgi:Tol biopolymer transport system component